jgi:hypothetical protein
MLDITNRIIRPATRADPPDLSIIIACGYWENPPRSPLSDRALELAQRSVKRPPHTLTAS